MGNWTMVWIDLAVAIVVPPIAYGIDYRAGIASPAFGLPDKRNVANNEIGTSESGPDLGADAVGQIVAAGSRGHGA